MKSNANLLFLQFFKNQFYIILVTSKVNKQHILLLLKVNQYKMKGRSNTCLVQQHLENMDEGGILQLC